MARPVAPPYRGGVGYRLLTTAILTAHFAFVGYVVFGGFLAWRWPRTIWLHAAAVSWGALTVTAGLVAGGVTCPLTSAEGWSRRRAGESGLTGGFIDRYIEGVIYPERYAATAQALAAAAVIASWIGLYLRRRQVARAA